MDKLEELAINGVILLGLSLLSVFQPLVVGIVLFYIAYLILKDI